MTLDLDKPVQTRDGRPARIVAKDRKGDFPIVALIGSNEELVIAYKKEGSSTYKDNLDLVNIPDPHRAYIEVPQMPWRMMGDRPPPIGARISAKTIKLSRYPAEPVIDLMIAYEDTSTTTKYITIDTDSARTLANELLRLSKD